MTSRYVVVSGVIFGLIALGQLLRAANQLPVLVGDAEIPVWASWVAAAIAGSMCAWAFTSRKKGQ
jgi:hypothetical protein